MSKSVKFLLLLLRLSMGWLLFYAGITKVLDSTWTAGPYLENAAVFSSFFEGLAAPNILPIINIVNEWGLTLLGASLILGAFVRFTGLIGAALMVLFALPVFSFPEIPAQIIYAFVLILLSVSKAGRFWGLDKRWRGY